LGVRVLVRPLEAKVDRARFAHVDAALAAALREALSKFRWLAVTDEKGCTSGLHPVGQILTSVWSDDRQYAVDGSLFALGPQVRVCIRLTDSRTGQIVWAGHFDQRSNDHLALIDDLSQRMGSEVERAIQLAETAKASRMANDSLQAHDCIMRAIPLIFSMNADRLQSADQLLRCASEAEPSSGSSYVWRAFAQLIRIGQQWAADLPVAIAEIDWLTRTAIERDPQDAMAWALRGHVQAFVFHDYERALDCFDRCLRLNPGLAHGWAFSAITFCYLGLTDEAAMRLARYRQLCPLDPYPFYFNTASCLLLTLTGRYERAVQVGHQVLSENPNYFAAYRPLIASLAQTGQIDEARAHLAKLHANEPHFTIEWLRTKYPPLQSSCLDEYVKGFRRAGVPES
jgi:TolB-like protein